MSEKSFRFKPIKLTVQRLRRFQIFDLNCNYKTIYLLDIKALRNVYIHILSKQHKINKYYYYRCIRLERLDT